MKDKSKPETGLDKQEQALWEAYMRETPPIETAEESFEALLAEENQPFADIAPVDKPEETPPTQVSKVEKGKKHSQMTPQLDRRTDEKLRRGKLPIDGRLDLHGMSQDEAHHVLMRYIEQSVLNGRRCILVITGKGKATATSEDWLLPGQGILKRRVPEWLMGLPHVLKTHIAQPHHGGSGALYVYLRRKR